MVKRKKTTDAPRDAAATADGGAGAEHANATGPGAESTAASRRKKMASSRIGRACDRCQHRKLACDPAPEGCPPCQKVNAWCTVTDPLTGTPTYRGEFEYLERQVVKQHGDIQELVAKLKALGEDVSAYEEETQDDRRYHAWMVVKASGDTRPWDREEKQLNVSRHMGAQSLPNGNGSHHGPPGAGNTVELPLPLDAPSSEGALKLPDLRTGLAQSDPTKFVGVAVSSPSSGRGPKLNILGWQLDLAQFSGRDEVETSTKPVQRGEAVYDRSYRSFIATAMGANPPIDRPDLPPKEDTLRIVHEFIQTTHPFLPVLHPPTLLDNVERCYDDSRPSLSEAEEACFHLLIASSCYQSATRGVETARAQLLQKSDRHYHYGLSSMSRFMVSDQLEDMQALALISFHVRAFPAPEIGWMACAMTSNRLIQLGFHRSMKSPTMRRTNKGFREIEMRKRIFWGVLTIMVTASGKLGRPMPIRNEDIDVEAPSAVADEQLLESGLDTSKEGKCAFLVGIECGKAAVLFVELFDSLYATKRSSKEYMQFVGVAERRLKAWQDQWPAEFQQAPEEVEDIMTRVIINHLHIWSLEFKLVLHHPSLSLTKSFQFNDNNLRVCLEVSKDMLRIARHLQQLHILDVNWYNCAVYLLAIQTTIYGHGQLKDELTEQKLEELKADMASWLGILKDIGHLLGSGDRLAKTVGDQVHTSITQLEKAWRKSLEEDTKPEPVTKQEPKKETPIKSERPTNAPPAAYEYPNAMPHSATFDSSRSYADVNAMQPTSTFPGGVSFSYGQPQPPMAAHSYGGTPGPYAPTFPMNLAAAAHGMTAEYGAQSHHHHHHPHGGGGAGSLQAMFESQPFPAATPFGPDSDSWFHFTQAIPNAIGPSDYQPASALLQLGGRTDVNIAADLGGHPPPGQAYDGSPINGAPNMMWTLNNMNGHPPPPQHPHR